MTPDVGTFLVSYSGLTNGLLEAVQLVRVDGGVAGASCLADGLVEASFFDGRPTPATG